MAEEALEVDLGSGDVKRRKLSAKEEAAWTKDQADAAAERAKPAKPTVEERLAALEAKVK